MLFIMKFMDSLDKLNQGPDLYHEDKCNCYNNTPDNMAYDQEQFRKLAQSKGLKRKTIDALLKEDHDCVAKFQLLTDDQLKILSDNYGISKAQKGFLKAWLSEIRLKKKPQVLPKDNVRRQVRRQEQLSERDIQPPDVPGYALVRYKQLDPESHTPTTGMEKSHMLTSGSGYAGGMAKPKIATLDEPKEMGKPTMSTSGYITRTERTHTSSSDLYHEDKCDTPDNMADDEEQFRKLAQSRGLKRKTIDALLKEDYNCVAMLRLITNDQLKIISDNYCITEVQKGFLRAWLSEIRLKKKPQVLPKDEVRRQGKRRDEFPVRDIEPTDVPEYTVVMRKKLNPEPNMPTTGIEKPNMLTLGYPGGTGKPQMSTSDETKEMGKPNMSTSVHTTRTERTHTSSSGRRNIAIVGEPSSGKSSLINALRRLEPRDHGAASTRLQDKQTEPVQYQLDEHTTLWEIPFSTNMTFDLYDAVVVCTSERLTESDVMLARQTHSKQIPCHVVRTKIDRDIESDIEDYGKRHNEKSLLLRIRNDIKDQMIRNGVDTGIFLISSKRPQWSNWDFRQLQQEIADVKIHVNDTSHRYQHEQKTIESQNHAKPHNHNSCQEESTGNQNIVNQLFNSPTEPHQRSRHVKGKDRSRRSTVSCSFVRNITDVNDQTVIVHIAIVGELSSGKSSLVNALRWLEPRDHGAASTRLQDKQTEPVEYRLGRGLNTTLWEIPPSSANMTFDLYDAVVVCTSERLTESDVILARQAHSKQIPCHVVRTKIDRDIESDIEDYGKIHNEKSLLLRIRKDIEDQMKVAGLYPQVYLISSKKSHWSKWDLGRLQQQIECIQTRASDGYNHIKDIYKTASNEHSDQQGPIKINRGILRSSTEALEPRTQYNIKTGASYNNADCRRSEPSPRGTAILHQTTSNEEKSLQLKPASNEVPESHKSRKKDQKPTKIMPVPSYQQPKRNKNPKSKELLRLESENEFEKKVNDFEEKSKIPLGESQTESPKSSVNDKKEKKKKKKKTGILQRTRKHQRNITQFDCDVGDLPAALRMTDVANHSSLSKTTRW